MWSANSTTVSRDGTRLHYYIECFMNQVITDGGAASHQSLMATYSATSQWTAEQQEVYSTPEWSFFLKFIAELPHLQPYRTEWMIYDPEHQIAGSIDMVYKNDDGTLSIYDWKRVKEINKNECWGKFSTLETINHIPDTNFWHYTIQLNMYKRILERNYGVVIRDLYLVRLHPNNTRETYDLIKLPFLPMEIDTILQYRKTVLENEANPPSPTSGGVEDADKISPTFIM
jgi:ATP-dependent exoDNAse (exonuclease V) beta subunit